jgi:dTDP-4-amino-4,6-dideoxygalactose transaminase
LYCGALPDFVDIDPCTYNLSIPCLERKLEDAKLRGTLPSVLVPVHFAGQSCPMGAVAELAAYYGFRVIEDASHAIGGSYRGSKVGSCTFSDMTVFSFHPVKIITTGEGGMILTNRKDLHERLLRLRSHGITREPDLMEGVSHGPWYYQQIELGFNYRLTDIQAALGLSQLSRLDQFVERRRYLAARYHQALTGLPLQLPTESGDVISAFHLYVVCLAAEEIGNRRGEVFAALRSAGIGVNVHYIPVHMQPYYQRLGFRAGDFPQAEAYYQHTITLPLHFGLTETEQDYVVASLREVLQ